MIYYYAWINEYSKLGERRLPRAHRHTHVLMTVWCVGRGDILAFYVPPPVLQTLFFLILKPVVVVPSHGSHQDWDLVGMNHLPVQHDGRKESKHMQYTIVWSTGTLTTIETRTSTKAAVFEVEVCNYERPPTPAPTLRMNGRAKYRSLGTMLVDTMQPWECFVVAEYALSNQGVVFSLRTTEKDGIYRREHQVTLIIPHEFGAK